MIKNLENLKKYNIICTNTDEVKECLDILKKLGFNTYEKEINPGQRFVKYYVNNCFCSTKNITIDYKDINFYQFKKQTKKFLKEKEKQLPDFEVAKDGRIIKINNINTIKEIYVLGNNELIKKDEIKNFVDLGLAFISKKTRDKAEEKQKIYIQLKNLAERLNKGQKIDWNDNNQFKYYFYFNYKNKKIESEDYIKYKDYNVIYCLDENFLDIAEKEIGEENLLKLFEN